MISVEGLSHVGIVVPDLEAASAFFSQSFGCEVGEPVDVPEQSLRLAYVELGPVRIELLSPTGPDSSVARFLERHSTGGLHHIALHVGDAAAAATAGARLGMRILGKGPTAGHHGRPLFFLHPKDTLGTLVEIEQSEDKPTA